MFGKKSVIEKVFIINETFISFSFDALRIFGDEKKTQTCQIMVTLPWI